MSDAVTGALRKVRVFISSTFLDMQEERDALNRVVFPYLRYMCSHLQIEFVGVDLRWGITEDEAKQGKTIDICMQEIEACYPFFIGILGKRYGWTPAERLRGKYAKLFKDGISVTEAEMEIGALRYTYKNANAIFCLRDNAFTKKLGFGRERKNVKKLTDLKTRILDSEFHTLDGYKTIDEFCDFIKAEMMDMITATFSPIDETDNFSLENRMQDFYVQCLNSDFVGRDSIMHVLDEYAQCGGQPLLLTGKTGSGKSSLLAHWILSYKEKNPNSFLFFHFCKASKHSADWAFLIHRLMNALIQYFNISFEIPEERGRLIYDLPKFLSAVGNNRITIVIDEAELLDAEDGFGLTWLPAELSANIRLVITAKKQAMDFLRSRDYRQVHVSNLSHNEQLALIDTYLPNLGKHFNDVQKQITASYSITKTPIYLKTLLQELSIIGRHELLTIQLYDYLGAKNTAVLLSKVLDRFERDYNTAKSPELVRDVFSLLYCSQQGLSESRLLAMLSIPHIIWYPLYLAIQPYVLNQNGVLRLNHQSLCLAVKAKYELTALAIRKIRTTFTVWLDGDSKTTANSLELAWLYYTLGSKTKLRQLLCDPERIPAFTTKLNTLKRYWAFVEQKTSFNSEGYYLSMSYNADFSTKLIIVKFLLETGKYTTAKTILNRLINDSSNTNMTDLQRAYGLLGKIEHKLGFYQTAKKAYIEQLNICEQANDCTELARTYGNLGNLEAEGGYFVKAQDMYAKATEIFMDIGDLDGVQNAIGNCASIFTQTGRFEEALELIRKRERICRESRNISGLIAALGNLSNFYLANGKHSEAKACLDEQEMLCRKIGDIEQQQEISGRRAIIFAEHSNYEEALSYFTSKLVLSRKIEYYDGEQRSLFNLSQLYFLMGDYKQAIDMAQKRKSLCYEHLVSYDYADANWRLAQIYIKSGDVQNAVYILNELEVFAQIHDYHWIRNNTKELLLQIGKGT